MHMQAAMAHLQAAMAHMQLDGPSRSSCSNRGGASTPDHPDIVRLAHSCVLQACRRKIRGVADYILRHLPQSEGLLAYVHSNSCPAMILCALSRTRLPQCGWLQRNAQLVDAWQVKLDRQ